MGTRLDPALNLSLRRLRLFGWWKIKSDSLLQRFAYDVYRALALLWLNLFALLEVLDLFEAYSDLGKLSTNLCGTYVAVIYAFRTLVILRRSTEVEDLQTSLGTNFNLDYIGRSAGDARIAERTRAHVLKLTNAFFALVVPTVLGWSAMPLVDEGEKRSLPLRMWLPFDWHSSPLYEIFYAYQVIGLWIFTINIISHDLVLFGFILQICSQYEILERNVRDLNRFRRSKNLSAALKRNIIHHQEILRAIKQVQRIYSESFFLHFSTSITLVCVTGFEVSTAIKSGTVTTLMLSRLGYAGTVLFDVYFFCAFGERLKQKGLDVSRALYDSGWCEMEPSPRRTMAFFMARAQASPSLTFGWIMSISLSSFLSIMRICYNILALMNQVTRRQDTGQG